MENELKWYDYLAAFIAADVMTTSIFSASIFGGLVAYTIYELWNQVYCQWRLDNVDE